MRIALLAVTVLLLLPLATAHTAAPPRSHETRLLHDCEDDYFGSDSATSSRDGYDLHTLDVREAWDGDLGHHLVFRIILNGEGQTTITVTMDVDGSSTSHTFQGSGSTWSGSFERVTYHGDLNDGPRFALEGAIQRSSLGAVGDKLTDYQVQGASGGDTHDTMPGDDTGPLQECRSNTERPDYTLKGPVQYVDGVFQSDAVQVQAGQEKFVTFTLTNKLRDAAQTVSLDLGGSGADLRFHDPQTGKYVADASFDLAKRGSLGDSASIHVAVAGDTPGTGTATVTITTDLGGRIQQTLDFEILAADATTSQTSTQATSETASEDSPGLPVALVLTGLVAIALARRR